MFVWDSIDNLIKMDKLLWLDDYRDPLDGDWLIFSPIPQPYEVLWVKNYKDFCWWITKNGLPTAICFDHDLGQDVADEKVRNGMSKRKSRMEKRNEMSGFECAKWLVEYCLDNNLELPKWNCQSANPVGRDNINGLLNNFRENQSKNQHLGVIKKFVSLCHGKKRTSRNKHRKE